MAMGVIERFQCLALSACLGVFERIFWVFNCEMVPPICTQERIWISKVPMKLCQPFLYLDYKNLRQHLVLESVSLEFWINNIVLKVYLLRGPELLFSQATLK